MEKLRALIFDVDGTLAETEDIHRRSFNIAFENAGLKWNWDKPAYTKLLTTTGGKERITRYIAEQNLPNISPADIARLHAAKNAVYADTFAGGGVSLRPGVARLIADARAANLKLGVATTTSKSNLVALLQCCFGAKCERIFDVMICGEDVVRKKPDPEVYVSCLAKLHVEPHQAIAFEDSGVGLRAALAAGLRTVVAPSTFTTHDNFSGASEVLADLAHFRL
jgi:HAD superfamily hydrolase (TIGR01509 family)